MRDHPLARGGIGAKVAGMTTNEGFRRIRMVGKTTLSLGLLLVLFLVLGLIVTLFVADSGSISFFGLGYLGIPLSIVGGAILVIGWVAEGFTNDARRSEAMRILRKAGHGNPPIPGDELK